jgi:hypothetical protein
MPIHSRPHLTTHNRSAGHSAVAAAAYRLGLRLLDRRTKTWHDYTKRKIGEEIVAAITVAPEGSPEWLSDPDELWNRVEACEKRKDAQIARDYVVPIPLGLDDRRAAELARRLAGYISETLKTPVSIGLHRDADTDLLGNPKPADKQGYHAHLLFPTRQILLEGEEGDPKDVAAAEHGFGAKLSALSNRRTSSGIVEQMNAQWAALANEMVAEIPGLVADYDHRSYERLGIDRTSQPRMARAAVAMEKKGFFTRQGDQVRDIIVASEAYKQTHADALTAQHAQAVLDVARETVRLIEPAHPRPTPTDHARSWEGSSDADPSGLAEDLAAARERGHLAGAALADRFVAQAPVPTDEVGRQRLFSLSGLVWAIQRALRAVVALVTKMEEHREQATRWQAARLSRLYELDEARRQRRVAQEEAQAWVKGHGWRVMAAQMVGSRQGWPRPLRALEHEVALQDQVVQDLKAARKSTEEEVAYLANEEGKLQTQHDRARARLVSAVEQFVTLDHQALPALMAVLPDQGRVIVEELVPRLPTLATIAPIEVKEPTLVPGAPRRRMSR